MSRNVKIWLWSAVGLMTILAVCIAVFLNFNWNHAKPWLNARVSEAIERPFAIQGDLSLTWKASATLENGWRRWVPWPHLNAQDITVGNPEWGNTEQNMAQIKQLTFSLNPLLLLDKKIVIPSLQLDAPDLTLERTKDGKNNWTFAEKAPSAWQLDLQQLALNRGSVHLVDAIKHADVRVEIDTPADSEAAGYGLDWKMAGTFNGEKVSGTGKAGAILSLQTQLSPYPIEAHVRVGKTTINVQGTLTKPRELAALDMRLKMSGVSMAQLYPLTGIVLPETSPYETEGHLIGLLNRDGGNWRYEKFKGRMGASDIAGTLEYQSKKPRPRLTGSVVSNVLQFKDLAPLIGADSNANKAKRGTPAIQPANKVLPVEVFKTERWSSIDTDVKFTGRKIIRSKELPIDNLVTNLQLNEGVLSLMPLNFGVAGGQLNSNIKLDGRNKIIKAEMKIAARHLKLKQLFPTFQPMQASFGEINGDASLSATGNSIATLLGSSNGEIKALINEGTISKLLLEQIGLNIGNVILSKLFGDKQVKLNCLASDFSVTRGLMQARTFVIDTDESIQHVSGQINLAQEQLDLTIKTKTKGVRIISLRAPLYVTGNFKTPQVKVDKGVLALKAGSAVALAAMAPFAALLPLANVGANQDSECAKLLADAQVRPVAPAPGKVYRAKGMRK